MDQDTDLPFDLPSVSRKKITAAFDGGRISSDVTVASAAPWIVDFGGLSSRA
ncbi:hypothetical protein [Asticcacaulis sp. W401b]|uniref:hypothetical protein n=1 Tax=Asticcacaulis sp. W401b TaxID=3388666 RepID=UPI003970E2E4